MSGILVLILRILLAIALYAFIGWALYTLWRELKLQTQLLQPGRIPALRIRLVSGAPEEEHTFTQPEVIIGRDPGCDLALVHETVSSRHARLNFHHNQWWVEDLQATNGTYLNDNRLEISTVLVNGDEIRCGQVILEIHNDERKKP